MKKLDISISKAQLTSYTVRFGEDGEIRVEATIALLTEQNKHVADFQISTHHWNDEAKFPLPLKMYNPIKKISEALEHVIVEHIREGQLLLSNEE